MAKKAEGPKTKNNGKSKKPDEGRAFIFGRRKKGADEFISGEGFTPDSENGAGNANSFFADDGKQTVQSKEKKSSAAAEKKDSEAKKKAAKKHEPEKEPKAEKAAIELQKKQTEEKQPEQSKSEEKPTNKKTKLKESKQITPELEKGSGTDIRGASSDAQKERKNETAEEGTEETHEDAQRESIEDAIEQKPGKGWLKGLFSRGTEDNREDISEDDLFTDEDTKEPIKDDAVAEEDKPGSEAAAGEEPEEEIPERAGWFSRLFLKEQSEPEESLPEEEATDEEALKARTKKTADKAVEAKGGQKAAEAGSTQEQAEEEPVKKSRIKGFFSKRTADPEEEYFEDDIFNDDDEGEMEEPKKASKKPEKKDVEETEEAGEEKSRKPLFAFLHKDKKEEEQAEPQETAKEAAADKTDIKETQQKQKTGKAKTSAKELKKEGKKQKDTEQAERDNKEAAAEAVVGKGNPFAAAIAWIKRILQKGTDKALKFAQAQFGGKKKRLKRILIFSGTGVVVTAVILTLILVPFGLAGDETDLDSQAALDAAVVQTPEPTQIPTEQPTPEVTPTPIVTTEPDPTHKTINVDKMVQEFMVEASLYYNEVGYSTNFYDYNENEMYMLAQLIHGEARGESLDGMVAVGNVVMNRVLNRSYFGNTISAVITASGQFSGYKSTIVPSSKCKIAARKVLDFQVWVVPQNVYYFKAYGDPGVDWGSHKYYTTIGGHNFYTHTYRGRSNTDKIPPRMYERTYKWPRLGCWPEDRVYRLQYMLNKLGYDVTADSYFGVSTMDAIKEFQEKKGLDVDGVAGPTTIEALIRAFGIEEFYDAFYT